MNSPAGAKIPLTRTQWLICIIASIGFAFDIYELLMLPLIVKPALASLGGMSAEGVPLLVPGTEAYISWARALFFIPAIAGGVFGLIGGYLTDVLGRRRVLTASILLYAGSAFAAGYATTLTQLLVLRCLVFIGVCVEFVAAVAWLAELFPDPHRREKVLGYTQAFSSIGGLLVAGANELAVSFSASLPAIHGAHEAWRYTLISGLIPAIPLILIRPFLPESPAWLKKKAAGQLRRPTFAELFTPELRRATVVSTVLFASCYGLAFGAIQHLPQIVPGMADVKAMVKQRQDDLVKKAETEGKAKPAPKALIGAGKAVEEGVAAKVQKWQEVGGLLGRFALAVLAVRILSRRTLLRLFHLPALFFVPLFFYYISKNLGTEGNLETVKWLVAVAGFLVVGTFSFWGNYLPLVYPVHLRGTGESFAANIGGRVLGTSAAWFTFTFSAASPPSPAKIALTAAVVAGLFAVVGAIITHWLPEPKASSGSEE
ncbi:MAG: MFS transporter [Verrucomicrobiales bacterium]|nr:MFS transporter [Verrucomicrobiales bacterium]